MMIVSTCTMTIDSSEFELNEEEREHQEQDTNPDYEITNSLALTVKTELTTHKKESIDQEKNETHLLTADNTETDHLNVFGFENTDEVICPPSADLMHNSNQELLSFLINLVFYRHSSVTGSKNR